MRQSMVSSNRPDPISEASAKGDDVDRFDRDIGQRARGLHLLLRDASGEVIVEEGHRLAQRPAMQTRQDQRVDIGADDDAVGRGAETEDQPGG